MTQPSRIANDSLSEALQPMYAKESICFGCGPANLKGLKIESRLVLGTSTELVAYWKASPEHQAFPGMLNGGIIGALLDCHSNWTAAFHLMKVQGLDQPPCTVTAEYSIKLFRPTPADAELTLHSKVIRDGTVDPDRPEADRAWIEATLSANGKICGSCRGLFVQVKPGHPAYHRW